MTKSITRTGKSITVDPMSASRHDLVTVGFTPEEADSMVSMRRVLPFDPDSKTPKYDARKLWERIGKPWGKFASWVEKFIKPELINSMNTEIIEIKTPTAKKPRTDYILSRDAAAHLAMQAKSEDGRKVRTYFLAMERAVFGLAQRNEHRDLTAEDKMLTHTLIKKAEGDKRQALEWERDVKNRVAEILSGLKASAWRNLLSGGKGIRDVLFTDDLATYDRAYTMYVGLVKAEQTRLQADAITASMFKGCIKPSRYGLASSSSEVILDF